MGAGIREGVFRFDCVGVAGTIDVEVSGTGGGGMDCHASGGRRGVVIQGIRPGDARAYHGHHDLTVLAWRLTQPGF